MSGSEAIASTTSAVVLSMRRTSAALTSFCTRVHLDRASELVAPGYAHAYRDAVLERVRGELTPTQVRAELN